MELKEYFESLKLYESEICICTPCIEIVLFKSGDLKSIASALSLLIKRFLKIFGNKMCLYNTASDSKMKSTSDQLFPSLIQREAMVNCKEETYGLDAHSGAHEIEARCPALDFFYDGSTIEIPHTYFRGVIDTTQSIERPDFLFNQIYDLVNDFQYLHGYVGYSFYWRTLDPLINERVTNYLGPILKRHPGFGYGNVMEFSEVSLDGIIAINWITMIGQEMAKRIGGPKKLKNILPKEVQIKEGKTGLLLRLGKKPEVGDRNRKDFLPLYRIVGEILSSEKAPSNEVWIEGLTEEDEMEDWFNRFFFDPSD